MRLAPQNPENDLARTVYETPLADTHEHMRKEEEYVQNGPDILQSLFGNYVSADLVVAGASQKAVERLLDPRDPDIKARFEGVRPAWEAAQLTGYGEAVRIIAREVYGIDELTAQSIEAAQDKHAELRRPGERLRLLREVANLDHVQTDHFSRVVTPDASGPDFFFYDISWADFSSGNPNFADIAAETGVEVRDVASLDRAMEAVFAQNAAIAIAVKSQHAYNRTLAWEPRTERQAAAALDAYLRDPATRTEEDRLCLGDWCWSRGVELAIAHGLPFKIHTGYYAGHSRMPVDYIRGGNLCPLLKRYLDARFVLMHIAYPYQDEMVALAKHYPNVYVDLCWAWSIDPYSASDFVRRCIHAVPANKLFIFGGDTSWPTASVAYARQTRRWFAATLQAEVDEGLLAEADAIRYARFTMRENQARCFNVDAKRAAMAAHPAQAQPSNA